MHKYIYTTLAGVLSISVCFSYILYNENETLKRLAVDLAVVDINQPSKSSSSDIYQAREAGKVDGKIEALLMMQNLYEPIDSAFAEKIIDIAASGKPVDNQSNPAFLSLLSQAAYHKGLHVGLESAQKEKDEEYEKGYHKAIDDFTCPATGNIKNPSQGKLIDVPDKKPMQK